MDKKKLKKVFIQILINLIVLVIGCMITHYLTLKEIEYDHRLDQNEDLSVNDLLVRADN